MLKQSPWIQSMFYIEYDLKSPLSSLQHLRCTFSSFLTWDETYGLGVDIAQIEQDNGKRI